MSRHLISLAPFSALLPLLVDSGLKGAALLAAAGLVALSFHKASAASRHLVWLVAVVAQLVVPLLSVALPQWRVLPGWAMVPARGAEAVPQDGLVTVTDSENRPDQSITSHGSNSEEASKMDGDPVSTQNRERPADISIARDVRAASTLNTGALPWREWLPAVWFSGFALLGIRLLAAHWLLRRAARGCRVLEKSRASEARIADAFEEACEETGVRQRVTLLVDENRTIPVVWGIFRPRLLLPAEAEEWDYCQLRSVLLHELAHLKRRDPLAQWLTQTACALHWWNPLVWLAAWRLHVERERACDDMVLATGVRPSAYAGHLLHVASQLSPARWTSACGLAMARKSSLEGRLRAVLSGTRNRRGVTRLLATAALLAGCAVAIPLSMLRAAPTLEPKSESADGDLAEAELEAVPTPASGAPEPQHKYAQSLFKKWRARARTDGKIPGALIGHVAEQVENFIRESPDSEETKKLAELRPRFDVTRDWAPAAAVELLDEVCAISTAPVSWADLPMEFDDFNTVKHGQPLPDTLAGAAWGAAAANGLRAAWVLEPLGAEVVAGTVLKARVLFHNTGKEPVIFRTETWHQSDPHTARGANGAEIKVTGTFYTGITPLAVYRLLPGDYCEVAGHGIAIGAGKYGGEIGKAGVGAIIEAGAGDEVTLTHTVDAAAGIQFSRPDDPPDAAGLWRKQVAERVAQEAPLPAEKADREQLIRRVMLDLTGVLPTVEEEAEFTSDAHPDALDRLVVLILMKPRIDPWTGKLPTGGTKFRVTAAAAPAGQLTPDSLLGFWRGKANGGAIGLSFHRPPAENDVQCDLYTGEATIGAIMSFRIAPDGKSATLLLMGRDGGEPFGILAPGRSGTLQFEPAGAKRDADKVILTRDADPPADEPQQKEAKTLFREWRKSAYADGTIPGALIQKLAEAVKAYVAGNPNYDSAAKLPKLLPRFDAARNWTPSEVVSLLNDVAYYATSPIEALLAEPSDALWESKMRYEIMPVKVADWSAEKNGLRIGMRIAEGEWRIGGKVRVQMWLHNAGAKAITFKANPERADVGLSVAAKDADGADHWAAGGNILIIAVPMECSLPAGFVAKIKDFELTFDAPDNKEKAWMQPKFRDLPPGPYNLRCTWSDADPSVSGGDNWTGELVSMDYKFTLGPAESDRPAPNSGTTLKPAAVQKLKWGETVNGLQMALAWPPSLGEPGMGDAPEFYLVVRNVSDSAVHFTADADAPNPRRLMLRKNGGPLSAIGDAVPMPGDWLLQPAQAALVRLFHLEERQGGDGGTTSSVIEADIRAFPQYSMTAEMSINSAPAGAWTGKLLTGETRGSVDVIPPKSKAARELLKSWETAARTDGRIPGSLIGKLAESVRQFIKYNPAWETVPQLEKMLARFEDSHDWSGQDAVNLLDELDALQESPVEVEFDRENQEVIRTGAPLPPELAKAPWGEPAADGLRLAWLLEPNGPEHRIGTPLKARCLIQNSGKEPVVFRARTWHQPQHQAVDAQGAEIKTESTQWLTRGLLLTYRLAPGEFVELAGPGIGVGAMGKPDDWKDTRVGTWIDARAGAEVTVSTAPVPLRDWNEEAESGGGSLWWRDHIRARISRHLPFPADAKARERLLYRVAMELFGTPVSTETNEAFDADTSPTVLDSLTNLLTERAGQKAFEGLLTSGTTTFRVLPPVSDSPEPAPKPKESAATESVAPAGAPKPKPGAEGGKKYNSANRTGVYNLGNGRKLYLCRPQEMKQWFTVIWRESDLWPRSRLSLYPNVSAESTGKWAVVWEPGADVLWWVDDTDVGKMRLTDPAEVLVDREGRKNNFSRDFLLPDEVREEFRKLGFVIGRDETPGRESLPGGNTGGQNMLSAEPQEPWSIEGLVTDADGKALADVPVRVRSEYSPTVDLVKTRTDAQGKYRAEFRMDFRTLARFRGIMVEPVRDGFKERNLAKAGEFNALLMAGEQPQRHRVRDYPEKWIAGAGTAEAYPGPMPRFSEQDLVPGDDARADFVMLPAAEITGEILTEDGSKATPHFVSVDAVGQRPGYNVAGGLSQSGGDFQLSNIPAGNSLTITVNPEGKPGQTSQSAAMKFEPGKPNRLRLILPTGGSGNGPLRVERF